MSGCVYARRCVARGLISGSTQFAPLPAHVQSKTSVQRVLTLRPDSEGKLPLQRSPPSRGTWRGVPVLTSLSVKEDMLISLTPVLCGDILLYVKGVQTLGELPSSAGSGLASSWGYLPSFYLISSYRILLTCPWALHEYSLSQCLHAMGKGLPNLQVRKLRQGDSGRTTRSSGTRSDVCQFGHE